MPPNRSMMWRYSNFAYNVNHIHGAHDEGPEITKKKKKNEK